MTSMDELARIASEEPDRFVEPPAWIGHIPFAFWLIDALKPKVTVELGTHTGNSYCAMLQAARKAGLDQSGSRFYAVDHWHGDEHSAFYDNSVYDELKAYHDPRYGHFSSLTRKSFEDAARDHPDGSVDLLHIDGFHTYEAVRHDHETWAAKMAPDGVIMFHDTNVLDRGFGVHRYFAEMSQRYPTYESYHGFGLGVLALGRASEEPQIAPLFEQPEACRSVFYQLGCALIDKFHRTRFIETSQAVTSVRADLQQLRERIAALEVESARLDDELLGRVEQVALATDGARKRDDLVELARRVVESGLFDLDFYRSRGGMSETPAAATAEEEEIVAALDYLERGEASDIPPSEAFDPVYYRQANPDVAGSGLTMLGHYIVFGRSEGRSPRSSV